MCLITLHALSAPTLLIR